MFQEIIRLFYITLMDHTNVSYKKAEVVIVEAVYVLILYFPIHWHVN